VTVSVVTMEGEDCSMENLGTTADVSGGQVEIVDPLQLGTKVVSLMGRQTLATAASVAMLIPDAFYWKSEEKGVLNKLIKEIGNVTVFF
jgi:hypothetical protein